MTKKISQLATAGALDGTELVELVQGGSSKKTTTQDIADLGGGGGTAATTTFTPAGNISAIQVQAAIEELDAEKLYIGDYDFSANAGAYPTTKNKLFVCTDDSVLPFGTWFIVKPSVAGTPSTIADFYTK